MSGPGDRIRELDPWDDLGQCVANAETQGELATAMAARQSTSATSAAIQACAAIVDAMDRDSRRVLRWPTVGEVLYGAAFWGAVRLAGVVASWGWP